MKLRPGFALITAMIVTTIIAGLMLHAAIRARADRLIASNIAVDVRARAAARGGVAQMLVRLQALETQTLTETADPSIEDRWNDLDLLEIGETELSGNVYYRVHVTDPSARLPINYASADELHRLFAGLGVAPDVAGQAADAIVAKREVSGPFGSVEGLAHLALPGLPKGLRKHLTVLGGGRVNLNTTTAIVLMSLPGITQETAEVIMERRTNGSWLHNLHELDGLITGAAQSELRANYAALDARAAFHPTLIEVVAVGRVPGNGHAATIHAVVGRGGVLRLVSMRES